MTSDVQALSGAIHDATPDTEISVREAFGIDSDMKVPAFSQPNDYVPPIDDTYRFDEQTTMAILAGFAFNRRVMIQGYHGTGNSTHIEQVAAPPPGFAPGGTFVTLRTVHDGVLRPRSNRCALACRATLGLEA